MMKAKRILCLTLAAASLSMCASCGKQDDAGETVIDTGSAGVPSSYNRVEPPTEITSQTDGTTDEPYAGPVNFEEMRDINPDIYAWIDIPNSDISYPILRREGDNSYYLNHDSYGNYDQQGTIYTEDYNSMDFEDPVNVIYGHCLTWNDVLFGSLEKNFSNKEYFDSHRELKIYLPDKELKYKIIAALPYSSIHLQYYYDFTDPYVFEVVMEDILSTRSIQANVADDAAVKAGDHVVILSTCLKSDDKSKRFFVVALRENL